MEGANETGPSRERRPPQAESSAVIPNEANPAEQPVETCQLTLLFTAISRSKSLQAVHYSGNGLNPRSVEKIKKILGVVDGHGYLAAGTREEGQLDRMFAELGEQADVQKINTMIQEEENRRLKKPEQELTGMQANQQPDINKRGGILKLAKQSSRPKKLQNA